MAVLETKDLRKIYGSGENQVNALDGVSISVDEGEFVAVVGTSGSGKSTLLNMIGGLDRPTSGNVIIRGKEILKMKDEELTLFRRRNIGFVFQNYNLRRTAAESGDRPGPGYETGYYTCRCKAEEEPGQCKACIRLKKRENKNRLHKGFAHLCIQ